MAMLVEAECHAWRPGTWRGGRPTVQLATTSSGWPCRWWPGGRSWSGRRRQTIEVREPKLRVADGMGFFEDEDITLWDKLQTIAWTVFWIVAAFGASWFFGFLDY